MIDGEDEGDDPHGSAPPRFSGDQVREPSDGSAEVEADLLTGFSSRCRSEGVVSLTRESSGKSHVARPSISFSYGASNHQQRELAIVSRGDDRRDAGRSYQAAERVPSTTVSTKLGLEEVNSRGVAIALWGHVGTGGESMSFQRGVQH